MRNLLQIPLAAVLCLAGPAIAAPVTEPANVFPAPGTSAGGAIGIGRLTSADAGRPGVLRLGLRGGFFQWDGFPVTGTSRLLAGELTGGYTFEDGLEVFGAYRNSSASNPSGYPTVIQAQGDVLLGLKASFDLDGVTIAGDARFDLKNGYGLDRPALDTSTVQARLLASWGLAFPTGTLEIHAQLGAILGRSADALRMDSMQVFGTGVSAYHRVVGGAGASYMLGRVNPFVTFDLDQPVAIENADLTAASTTLFGAAAKRIGLGARIFIGPAGALDVALQLGSGTGARGFAKTNPYELVAAYAFAFDSHLYAPPPPPPAPEAPPPTTGQVTGTIHNVTDDVPVAGAIVSIEGSDIAPCASDAAGHFLTHDLQPGPVTLRVVRDGFKPTTFEARVAAGRAAPADIHLEALPPPPPPTPAPLAPPPPPPPPPAGFLAGRIEAPDSRVPARLRLTGPQAADVRTEADGSFSLKLPPGTYDLTVLPDAFFARSAQATVAADQVAVVVLRTTRMPVKPTIRVEGDEIIPVKPLKLDERKREPDAADLPVLAEIADLLVRDPSRRLLIEVFADVPARAGDDRQVWTEVRAAAFKLAMIDAGAAETQIEAKGLGLASPLFPVKSKDVAKNRRVALHFVSKAPAPAPDVAMPADEPALTLPVPAQPAAPEEAPEPMLELPDFPPRID